jgi:hypothetical protein
MSNIENPAVVQYDSSGTEKGTSGNPQRVDPTGTTTQPVSAASLPLPSGAATEATLAGQAVVDNAGFTDGTTKVQPVGFILDEVAGTALTENDAAAARIDSKRAQVHVLEDATTRGQRLAISAAGAAKVDGSAVTQPISASSLPLPSGAAQEHTAAATPSSARLSDGSAFYDATKTGQLPSALIGGRLDANNGAWLGSTAPTVGQKAMASSLPVTIASDQSAVPVSAASLPLPTGAAQEHTAAATPSSARLSDGAAFYDAAKTGQLPAALTGSGNLKAAITEFTSAIPTGTNKIGSVSLSGGSQAVHANATITASGNLILSPDFAGSSVNLVINIKNSPTGTTPTITFTIQEVDPGDSTTVFGTSASTPALNAVGVTVVIMPSALNGGNLKVSWTVGGSGPSFTGVYVTLVQKMGPTGLYDFSSGNPITGYMNLGAPQAAMMVAGRAGTGNLHGLRVDTSGRQEVIGGAAVGAAQTGAPVAIAGKDASGNVQIPKVDSNGSQVSVITSPNGPLAGLYASLSAYGNLRVTQEATALFNEMFDAGLDTTVKWTAVNGGAGSAIPADSAGIFSVLAGTTANAWSGASTKPTFSPFGITFLVWGAAIDLEAAAMITGNYRFWGLGTIPGTPTTTTPITNGIGFGLDASGTLRGEVWANGTRVGSVDLTAYKPTDGLYHRYGIVYRTDLIIFYIDSTEIPKGTLSYTLPQIQTLPGCYLQVNGGSTLSGATTFQSQAMAIGETGKNAVQISDGVSPWLKTTVKAASTAPTAADPSLVVVPNPYGLPTFRAVYDRIVPANNKYMATLFNASATRKVVIQRIWVYLWQFSSVTGVILEQEMRWITARTSGTAVTPIPDDSADTLSASITADHNSSAVTELSNGLIRRVITSSEETALRAGGAPAATFGDASLVYERAPFTRGLVLRNGRGLTLKNVVNSTVGTVSYVIEFTDEVA